MHCIFCLLFQSLGAVRTVASFGSEGLSVSRYLERLKPAMRYGIRSGFVSGVGTYTSKCLIFKNIKVLDLLPLLYLLHMQLHWDMVPFWYTMVTIAAAELFKP